MSDLSAGRRAFDLLDDCSAPPCGWVGLLPCLLPPDPHWRLAWQRLAARLDALAVHPDLGVGEARAALAEAAAVLQQGGAQPGGAQPGGAQPGGAQPDGAQPGGAQQSGG